MRDEEEVALPPPAIEAGAAKIFALACYIPGLFLTHEECREFATEAYLAMRRAGFAPRPPGYRNASEDEPERTAGWKP